jgi:hypothetical protein
MTVVPAKAGIHRAPATSYAAWIPAFAGTTHVRFLVELIPASTEKPDESINYAYPARQNGI